MTSDHRRRAFAWLWGNHRLRILVLAVLLLVAGVVARTIGAEPSGEPDSSARRLRTHASFSVDQTQLRLKDVAATESDKASVLNAQYADFALAALMCGVLLLGADLGQRLRMAPEHLLRPLHLQRTDVVLVAVYALAEFVENGLTIGYLHSAAEEPQGFRSHAAVAAMVLATLLKWMSLLIGIGRIIWTSRAGFQACAAQSVG